MKAHSPCLVMRRDDRFVRRNALVVPGVLLATYGLLVLGYAGMRSPGLCTDASRIMVGGVCYSLLWPGLVLALVGLGLVVGGAVGFRGRPAEPEGHLRLGTPTWSLIALLSSVVVVGVMGYVLLGYFEGRYGTLYTTRLGGTLFTTRFVLGVAAAAATVVLATHLGTIWAALNRERHALDAALADEQAPGNP